MRKYIKIYNKKYERYLASCVVVLLGICHINTISNKTCQCVKLN